jgi:hypothetical protein
MEYGGRIKRTATRMPAELHRRAKHYAADMDTTLEKFVQALVEKFFEHLDNPSDVNPTEKFPSTAKPCSPEETHIQKLINDFFKQGDAVEIQQLTYILPHIIETILRHSANHKEKSASRIRGAVEHQNDPHDVEKKPVRQVS